MRADESNVLANVSLVPRQTTGAVTIRGLART